MEIPGNYEPKQVFRFFGEICSIPRPSKKEGKIISYLEKFAVEHKLEFKTDDAGNVLISRQASPGREKTAKVVLQSHLDMVCEKNSDVTHDFENEGITPYVEDGWIKARNTTLGADDGIGVAAQLALLSGDYTHGPIECLFTVDEETGLTGAFNLGEKFFEGKILINLDSEDEGELYIGCAGGMDTVAEFTCKTRKVPSGFQPYEISIKGLQGGHSGDDIHKGLGNSNKIINRFLWNASRKFKIRISLIDGGNLRNAIPREASAIILVSPDDSLGLMKYFKKFSEMIREEFKITEPGLVLSMNAADMPENVVNRKTKENLLNALYACPHGVIEWSREMEGLVQTSTNLASVKFIEGNKIVVTTSQRSSVNSSRKDIVDMVTSVFRLAKAETSHSTGYPGWKPDLDSRILKITRDAYKELFGKDPGVRAIHAGLECGLFLEKYPYLDMISIGPTIKGAHSPDERLEISSVKKFWDLLLKVLESIPAEKN